MDIQKDIIYSTLTKVIARISILFDMTVLDTELACTRGGCYTFALMVQELLRRQSIACDIKVLLTSIGCDNSRPRHCILFINDKYYDVYGEYPIENMDLVRDINDAFSTISNKEEIFLFDTTYRPDNLLRDYVSTGFSFRNYSRDIEELEEEMGIDSIDKYLIKEILNGL